MSAEESRNFSVIVSEVEGVVLVEDDYDRVLADLWVGVTLSLTVVSCVGILVFCFFYRKFQQWKFQVLESQVRNNLQDAEASYESDSLPSYTLVTGLPSYEEAMEQLNQVQCMRGKSTEQPVEEIQQTIRPMIMLSVTELFQYYRPPSFKQ